MTCPPAAAAPLLQVLSCLDSSYIIKYYDSFLEHGKLFIITEYASRGNLHDFIKRQRTKLPEDLIWKLLIQMLSGLNHMHTKKILHRDFKTLNVFLDDDNNVKMGDMGVARILSTHTNFARTIVGTPYYLSPELCEDKPYNAKSDVWALGVALYECCTQKHPFDADNQASAAPGTAPHALECAPFRYCFLLLRAPHSCLLPPGRTACTCAGQHQHRIRPFLTTRMVCNSIGCKVEE